MPFCQHGYTNTHVLYTYMVLCMFTVSYLFPCVRLALTISSLVVYLVCRTQWCPHPDPLSDMLFPNGEHAHGGLIAVTFLWTAPPKGTPPPTGQPVADGWLLWAWRSPSPWPQFRKTHWRPHWLLSCQTASPLPQPGPRFLVGTPTEPLKVHTQNSSWPESVSRPLNLRQVCFSAT